ncbi:MAG: WYL domain-containing protein [Alistipes sp.]|nr:WYL domain-containing protein [Alistipes sp.]
MVKKNAIMRYKILDSLLSNRNHYYTITDLVDKVNEALELDGMEPVSRRCIEKDLNALECAPYDADITRDWKNGRKYIRYGEAGFSIFTKKLSDDEENLLSEVLNTLGQFSGLNNFEWLECLKSRLDIKEHRQIIQFDSNPYLQNSTLLGGLFTAISNEQVLNLKYHTFSNPQIREVVVHPYLLKQYNKRWFLLCGAEDETILTFAIDRIDDFELLPHIKYIYPTDELGDRFDDIVGVTLYNNKPIEDILLWVSVAEYPYITTKPLHGSQKEVKNEQLIELREKYATFGDGHFIRLKCVLNVELEQLLMSHMDQVVVLEPEVLREKIVQKVASLQKLYGLK